jgi:peroxiredoxin
MFNQKSMLAKPDRPSMCSIPQNLAVLALACLVAGCSQSSPVVQESEQAVASAKTENGQPVPETRTIDEPVASEPETQQQDSATPKASSNMGGMAGMGKMKFPAPEDMKFKDKVESNVEIPNKVSELVFTDKDGKEIRLADLLGKKNLILVFTEGFNGMLCPFCKTQTSRLVANYDKFKQRDCEVIVVYPGPKDHLDEFIEAARTTEKKQVDKVPFPIVLDKDFSATNYFDIHSMHAHPSTYLIDKQGSVKFAYVGADMTADRPSVKALLDRLDQLQ